MAKNKVYHNSRHWLNPNDVADSGAISIFVDSDSFQSYVNADISIWDCSRKIVLDLSFSSEHEAKARATKLDIIINDLIKMREALGKAYVESQNFMEDDEYG